MNRRKAGPEKSNRSRPLLVEHLEFRRLLAANILLGRPTDQSITFNVIPDESGEMSVEFGTASGVYSDVTGNFAATAGEPVEFVVDTLAANTEYFYRLRTRPDAGSPWTSGDEYTFQTQRASGEEFTFTVIADSHLGNLGSASRYEQATHNVAADHPDFHVDLGDTFVIDNVSNQAQVDAVYLAQRDYFGNFSQSAPVYLALGNHENEEGWNFDDTPVSEALLSVNARKEYYLNPVTDGFYSGNDDPLPAIGGDQLREDYYAWEWGDALFIVLDPFQYTMQNPYGAIAGEGGDDPATGDQWNWTLGQEQYDWFRQTLENSDAEFKFVFSHHVTGGQLNVSGAAGSPGYVRGGANAAPYFEWGGLNADGSPGFEEHRPGWGGKSIHQLMVENGVSAFFHGHDHQYAYEVVDGIVYQEVPTPGLTGNGFNLYSESDPDTIKVLPNSGHLRVAIDPNQNLATVDYVRSDSTVPGTNGQVSFSYTIEGGGTTPGTEIGDTLATALATGLGPAGGSVQLSETVGDGSFGTSDVDLFAFQAAAGSSITAETSQPAGSLDMDTYMRLFDASGNELAASDDIQDGNGYSRIANFTLAAGGTYYIGVTGFPNTSYDPTVGGSGVGGSTGDYDLSLTLNSTPSAEAGDTLATALDTGLGPAGGSTQLSDTVGDGNFGTSDVDLFAFQSAAGSSITAETSQTAGSLDMDTYMRLFDASGNELAASDDIQDGNGYSRIANFTLPSAGTYYIGVTGFPNAAYDPTVGGSGVAGSTGNYDLSLTLNSTPSAEAGDTLATALDAGLGPAGGSVQFSQSVGDGNFGTSDVDLFAFEAGAGGTITAETSQSAGSPDMDTYMRLFDAVGNELAASDDIQDGNGYSRIANFTLPSAGTYYIGVTGFPNAAYDPTVAGSGVAGSTGDYDLSLTLTSTPIAEAGDTLATALDTGLGPAGGSAQFTQNVGDGSFGASDVDLFAFQADAGSTITAETSQSAGSFDMDTYMRLFDASGNELAASDDIVEGNGFSQIAGFTLPSTGTYYVGVTGFPNTSYDPTAGGSGVAGSTGDYDLSLTLNAALAPVVESSTAETGADAVVSGLAMPATESALAPGDANGEDAVSPPAATTTSATPPASTPSVAVTDEVSTTDVSPIDAIQDQPAWHGRRRLLPELVDGVFASLGRRA